MAVMTIYDTDKEIAMILVRATMAMMTMLMTTMMAMIMVMMTSWGVRWHQACGIRGRLPLPFS